MWGQIPGTFKDSKYDYPVYARICDIPDGFLEDARPDVIVEIFPITLQLGNYWISRYLDAYL